jgi:hypothetical protein
MLLCGSANISHKHPTFRLGLNYKFVGTDRSASQIRNPGVTPGFFVERTGDADVRFWPIADIETARWNVRFRGNSGHHNSTASCLLLTQSGHPGF